MRFLKCRALQDKSFYKRMMKIALPISMQGMISIGINMLDTIMLGQMGEAALSASSLANQFINIFHTLCMGLSGGAVIQTAFYWGKKDIPTLKKYVTMLFRLILLLTALFTTMVLVTPETIMHLYTRDAEVIGLGVTYLLWSFPAHLLEGLTLSSTHVLRSTGKVKIPFIGSTIGFGLNLILNWLLIFGNLGAPKMGIAGAALATTLSRVVETGIVFGYLILRDQRIQYRIKDFFISCKGLYKTYFKYAVPLVITDFLMSLGNSVLASIMGALGRNYVSANSIVSVTVRLSTIFMQGVANAAGIMTGHTLGEGKPEKAQDEGGAFVVSSVFIGLLASAIILLFSTPIISCFNITEETAVIAQLLMRAVSLIVPFQVLNGVLSKGILRNGGDTTFIMIIDAIMLWVINIPMGYLAAIVFKANSFWIYFSMHGSTIISAIIYYRRMCNQKWMQKMMTAAKGS